MSYILSDNIILSIGNSTKEVLSSIEQEQTGITNYQAYKDLTAAPVSLINREKLSANLKLENEESFTFFEQIAIKSITLALKNSSVKLDSEDTLLILSTTKGNIELLENSVNSIKDGLIASAVDKIAKYFNCSAKPVIISNACISGILALSTADRYIRSGKYNNVVVCGADIVSKFVVAGFESFKSMSATPCKPYDANRVGLSLGEGAGTIVLGKEKENKNNTISIAGSGAANDANHISGPSRTGEGAFLSASKALNNNNKVDYISAHGTATPYNDDMESVAIGRLKLDKVPVNSFKGYFGHTLGAAGIIESILTVRSMQQNKIYKTLGLEELGVANKINVITEHKSATLNRCLKIASGFGGCNAAIVFEKNV